MAEFATEAAVRLRFQWPEGGRVPADLVAAAIADAHDEVLRRLASWVDPEAPEDALCLGETLLAGARVLSALAAKDATDQRHVTVGGQRVEEGARFSALTAMADRAEREAWAALAPYLEAAPETWTAGATDSQAVLGGE